MDEIENHNQFQVRPECECGLEGNCLADTAVGHEARVIEVHEPGATGERLLEAGLTPGTTVRVVRRGLFGDPVQLSVRGYMLSLRREQARHVAVELSQPT